MSNHYVILGVILDHCPDGNIQGLMSAKYNQICMQVRADFERNQDLEIEKAMVGILNDGLKYGNWPWTSPVSVDMTPDPDIGKVV